MTLAPSKRPIIPPRSAEGKSGEYSGSCMPQVEFEFSTWVPPKATHHYSGSSQPSCFLFVYIYEWVVGKKVTTGMAIGIGGHCRLLFWQWLPTLIAVPAVALNSSSVGELKLYLGWKRNTEYIAWILSSESGSFAQGKQRAREVQVWARKMF